MNLKHLGERFSVVNDVTIVFMTESGQKSIDCGLSGVSEPLHMHGDLKTWFLSRERRINQCSCKEVAVYDYRGLNIGTVRG